MKKINAIKTYKWKLNMPDFMEGKSYEVIDDMADEMVKHGYAEFCVKENENKMIDLQSNNTSKTKKTKKNK